MLWVSRPRTGPCASRKLSGNCPLLTLAAGRHHIKNRMHEKRKGSRVLRVHFPLMYNTPSLHFPPLVSVWLDPIQKYWKAKANTVLKFLFGATAYRGKAAAG
ncbi:hypothetical protein Y1Q_0000289 [Alligator mississippiensis]|uniref:Uncharacterized protein n=1 Tax=Alligator mississippiensis TaxID=8496 RepID=A0A151P0J9_ALLMI|nr:hypothetical protein Y1Q_0000289 [Alligator mississippiensis]